MTTRSSRCLLQCGVVEPDPAAVSVRAGPHQRAGRGRAAVRAHQRTGPPPSHPPSLLTGLLTPLPSLSARCRRTAASTTPRPRQSSPRRPAGPLSSSPHHGPSPLPSPSLPPPPCPPSLTLPLLLAPRSTAPRQLFQDYSEASMAQAPAAPLGTPHKPPRPSSATPQARHHQPAHTYHPFLHFHLRSDAHPLPLYPPRPCSRPARPCAHRTARCTSVPTSRPTHRHQSPPPSTRCNGSTASRVRGVTPPPLTLCGHSRFGKT